jgi:putative transposase
MVAYAPRHGEQEIPYRSVQPRMALHQSPHLPEPAGLGRPRLHGLRAILEAVFYVLKSGCPWRLLPRDFPPRKTVYDWFSRWRIDGTWERLRRRAASASKAWPWQGPEPQRRYRGLPVRQDHRRRRRAKGLRDGGKKVRARKRHLLVDNEGLVLRARVHNASSDLCRR